MTLFWNNAVLKQTDINVSQFISFYNVLYSFVLYMTPYVLVPNNSQMYKLNYNIKWKEWK